MKKKLLLIIWLIFSGCSTGGVAEVNFPSGNNTQVPAESEHFRLTVYGTISKAASDSILNRLERNFTRVCNNILGAPAEGKTVIKVWSDQAKFYEDMERDLGVVYHGAAGYVYGPAEARIFYMSPASSAQAALHEFCHCVSIRLNRTIPNNPRWLWEAVAIFESGEFIHPRYIERLVSGNFPAMSELNRNFNQGGQIIYQVGYLIADYIISSFGYEKYRALIINNGDITGVLSLTGEQFDSEWEKFVKNKYSI